MSEILCVGAKIKGQSLSPTTLLRTCPLLRRYRSAPQERGDRAWTASYWRHEGGRIGKGQGALARDSRHENGATPGVMRFGLHSASGNSMTSGKTTHIDRSALGKRMIGVDGMTLEHRLIWRH